MLSLLVERSAEVGLVLKCEEILEGLLFNILLDDLIGELACDTPHEGGPSSTIEIPYEVSDM